MTRKLEGRIALVTGASRGIGRAAAVALAEEGAHVIALARGRRRLEELIDDIAEVRGTATLLKADLKDPDSIDRVVSVLLERWGKLDILCGNAAIIGPQTALADVVPREWDDVMNVNVTANFRLMRVCHPLLERSDAGRVILMTSAAAWKRRPHMGPYSISKAALEALGETYAREVASTPIKVMMVDPGPMRTAMRATAVPDEDPTRLPEPAQIVPELVAMAAPSWAHTGKLLDFSGPTPRLRDLAR